MSFRPDDDCTAHGRLLGITERLHDAIMARDEDMVHALLDMPSASSLPRKVREEALVVMALPATSMRAPIQLLQFHHRMSELMRDDDAGEALPQLEMPFGRWDSRRSA
ncbi:MAG: hypothetical protein H0X64_05420 [Gemmatimonadaceae bacterium]|nr:hypothetical protein [Gemmatimonadaceae bacterium]